MSYNESKATPAISVCMGVFNIADLPEFDRAISSILEQDFANFECLICDDGSNDRTWELLQAVAARDDRIRLLRNPCNMGLAATLNHCIKNAKAPIIARHDADDYSVPDRFSKQYTFLETHHEIDFVGSDAALYDMEKVFGSRCFPAFPQKRDFLFTVPFLHGALMFRRQALDKVGGYRVAKVTRRVEDYDLLMRMYAEGLRGANISEPLYFFLEDQRARKRRKYRYRVDEMRVRYAGFKRMKLLPIGILFVIKPLIVGLIPGRLLHWMKQFRSF